MSGILIHTQQKGQLRQSVAVCIHMHTPSTAAHSFTALSCDSAERCQFKSRRAGHVFLTSDWQCLISCWLRLPVKLLQQRIEAKNWILYGCSYHTQGRIQHIWGDILLTERGLFPAVCRSTAAETISKDKSRVVYYPLSRLCIWQTCMFM